MSEPPQRQQCDETFTDLELILNALRVALRTGQPIYREKWLTTFCDHKPALERFFAEHNISEEETTSYDPEAESPSTAPTGTFVPPIGFDPEATVLGYKPPSSDGLPLQSGESPANGGSEITVKGKNALVLAGNEGGNCEPVSENHQIGQYRLQECVGRGGMGEVWKACHVELGRVVALKMIRAGELATTNQIELFRMEQKAVAMLDHPNIVPIYEVGEERGLHFFAMKLVEGTRLKERIDELVADPPTAAKLLATVARTVHHAHERGILHRDLKPTNILLDENDEPVVIDFGLAKRLHETLEENRAKDLAGTAPYMAPEQTRVDGVLTTAVDIYALGAVLYHCLTGQPPFNGPHFTVVLHLVRQEPPSPPRELNPLVPSALETICLRCLQKKPEERFYRTAEELAKDLERYLEDDPISGIPVPWHQHFWNWCRKHPKVATLSCLLVVAFIIGSVCSTYFWIRTRQEAFKANAFAKTADRLRLEAVDTAKREKTARHDADAARELAEWELYVSQLSLAQKALQQLNHLSSLEHLKLCPERFRHWEYHHLVGLAKELQPTVMTHTDMIWDLALSPQGALLAGACNDGCVRLWDAQTGKPRGTIRAHGDKEVWGVDWRTESILATAGADGTVKIWNIKHPGKPLWILSHEVTPTDPKQVWTVAFSPDKNHIASGCTDKKVRVWKWDGEKAPQLHTTFEHDYEVWSVVFSPDSKLLASAAGTFERQTITRGSGEAWLWDLSNEKPVARLAKNRTCTEVAFSSNSRWIAIAGYDGLVQVYDRTQGKITKEFDEHADPRVISLAFSPDNEYLASGSWDTTVKLWNLATGKATRTLRGHRGAVPGLAFSPDQGGRFVFTSSGDIGQSGTIHRWDLKENPGYVTLSTAQEKTLCVAFRVGQPPTDPPLLASAGEETGFIELWDLDQRKVLRKLQGHSRDVHALAFSPDGRWLASGSADKTVRLWDLKTDQPPKILHGHTHPIVSLCFHPDGKTLASGSGEPDKFGVPGKVILWQVESGQIERELTGHHDGVYSLVFDRTGTTLVSTSGLWDGKRGRQYVRGEVFLWNLDKETTPKALEGHQGLVLCAAFDPDHNLLATAGVDKTICLWDMKSSQLLKRLTGHMSKIHTLAFSSDGERLASASADQTIKLWHVSRRSLVMNLPIREGRFRAVTFSPDGLYLAAACTDVTVKVWRGAKRK